ncbi:MAG: tetratricopeptide repeat protein, partial [Cyanobacteria bacterium J06592_8]
LAGLYLAQGQFGEAESLYKSSVMIRLGLTRQNNLNVVDFLNNALDTAKSLDNLGTLYLAQERYDEAETLYKLSLTIREKYSGENGENGENHSDTAKSFNNLGTLYLAQERYDEAEPLFQRSLAIREKVLGENHSDIAESLNYLAKLYRSQGRYDEAESLIQRIQSIQNPASK